jgi:hypothetical protein
MFQEIRVGRKAHPEARTRPASGGNRSDHAREVSGLGRIGGKVVKVSPDRLQLPTEAV